MFISGQSSSPRMGDDTSPAAMAASAVSVENKSGAQLALALTVFALVLASNSIINESWRTTTLEVGDFSFTNSFSLTERTVDNTANDDVDTESFESIYDDDCKDPEGELIEEYCSAIKDYHDAGIVAIIMLILSSIILLVATVMQVRSMIGMGQRVPNIISAIGGILVGLSVLSWWLMLPEIEKTDFEWGQGFWMALVAAGAGLIAGFSGTLQSWIDGPPRMRAHGVRAGLDMNEFVLKESSCGNHTLSILADSDLVRVVRVERIGASPAIKDVLATRRDSYTGFSHQRLDWLDDFKGLWWVISGATLISSFMISSLFLIPFTVAALLALMQLMDPERFVVSTNSGNHPFYINRWRSNRELTNLSMDLVDDAMIAVLRGEELDTDILDARSDLIAERFSAERDAKQEAEQAAAEEKAAFIEAVQPAPEQPVVEVIPAPPEAVQEAESTNDPTADPDWPETNQSPLAQIEAAAVSPVVIEAEPQDEPQNEPEVEAEVEVDAPGEEIETISEPTPPPAIEQPVTIPPPPPLPGVIAPPPPMVVPPPPMAAIPPPPPMVAAMPPPPPMAAVMPPPPPGAAILPPMAPAQVTAPPPVVVQGAPREDNLSEGEKDDLLGDLNSD